MFLDVDGTLIDFAPTPDAARAEPGLPLRLVELSRRFDGALALVSGRAIESLDRLFAPVRLPAAGIHGVERRDYRGQLHFAGFEPAELNEPRRRLRDFVAAHPGTLLEDKGRSLALHYRLAPHLQSVAQEFVQSLHRDLPPLTQVQPGHFVIEIKSEIANKATAIEEFMQEPPFAGRVPVFIGDDVTDWDGFRYVEAAGGHAIYVGPTPHPQRGWFPDPASVRQWLEEML